MSAETLEPPPISETESDQLKASFNASLKAETDKTPEPEVKIEEKKEPEGESIVPKELLQEKKEPTDEPLVSEEVRGSLKGAVRQNFEKLETAAKTRIEALRKELAEARAVKPVSQDAELLTKQAKEATERAAHLEAEFERVAYTQSPKYQRYGNEESAEIKSAKSYLEGGEINPAIIDAAAQTTGAARMKILKDSGMDAETIAVLSPHLARVDSIRRERDQSLEGWKANLANDQQQAKAHQEQQEGQRRAQEKAVYDGVMDKMKTLPAFTRVEGNEKWNVLVDQNLKDAEDFAQGRKPLAELFELGFHGVANRTTLMMNQELTKQLNSANSELARLKAAQPGIGKAAQTETKKVDSSKDPIEHWKSTFNAAMEDVKTNGYRT